MNPSLLVSKITPPRAAAILPRPRLLERLRQNRDHRLALVLGQAAQGKTTLALDYAAKSALPWAWLNLGPEDADAVDLFHLLGQSLQRALPQLDFSALLTYPSLSLGPREEGPLHREWAAYLVGMLSEPVGVILDGLDRLPAHTSASRFLQALLEAVPPQLHLLMLSREMPPFAGELLQDPGRALILTNEELAFTLAETAGYFTDIRRFFLAPELIRRLHELTEGWIGGLVLLCDSLDWVPESQRARYISQEMAGKFIGGFFQFFGEKIFASLPGQVQEFLIRSSILDVMEPDFIRESMGMANAQVILEDLARRHLFVQRLYDKKRGWFFRYHQLFKDFLQSKFKTLVAQDQQLTSYFQAGSLSRERGELEVAVRYFLRGGAYAEAAQAIENVGLDLVRLGKTEELSQWLDALPPELVQGNPWLLFYQYMAGRFKAPQENIFRLNEAYHLFRQQGDARGCLLSLAYLLEASIARGHQSIPPVHNLLALAEELLKSLAANQHAPEQAVLWLQMGFAYYLRSGNPRKGVWACQNAYLLARDLGDVPLQINALIHAHGCLGLLGEFHRAEEMVLQVEKLLERGRYPELLPLHLVNASQLYRFQGDLPRAVETLQRAREETEKYGLAYLYLPIMLDSQLLKIYAGEYSEAEEIGHSLVTLASTVGNLFVQGDALLHVGLSFYQEGNLIQAREMLARARDLLSSPAARGDLHLSIIKILQGLISCHLQENGDAAQEMTEALNHVTEISAYQFMKEAHLALALLKQQQGRAGEAAAHLGAGLGLAQERGYFQNLLLNREDLLRVLILALESEVTGVSDYVTRVFVTRLADVAGPELERLCARGRGRVAQRAWEVRRALHRGALPRLAVQTLGGFRLRRGEAPVEEKDLEGHQPQLLLKALVARGAAGVPKDLLIEDLWPDGSPPVTEKNFKVNLHRLRKALEPGLSQEFGSSYVHLKANLISLDPELVRVDVDDFLSLIKEGAKREERGEAKGALASYSQAAEIYGGDFLAEELYLPWAAARREELKGKFVDLLYRLAGLYEKQGTLSKASDCLRRLIQTDPLAETACQKLMLLYARRGMRSAALRVYEALKKVLQEELAAEPDQVTTAIYQKIL
jgi:DNA-binding SARP family transcriptional activator